MFDEALADRAVRFIELLKLTADFHGQPYRMIDWQRDLVRDVFGTLNERGVRQYRHVYVEIAKKNAKSQLAAALGALQLFNKHEPNGEIILAAGDKEQARKDLYAPLVEMIEQEPALLKRVRITDSMREIVNKETGTKLKVISHEAYTKHGWNISFALMDELHAWPSRELYDILTHGAGMARRQPLWIVLTTAGNDPDRVSVCWEQHETAKKVIAARQAGDAGNDIPEWYPVIYSYEGEDIYNPENWKKANPSLGVTFPIETMQAMANEARLSPAKERLFRWLNLSQWITTKLSGWLPLDLFDQTVGEWSRGELLGLDCFLGGDFSTTTDLSALCLVFPPQEKDGKVLEDYRVIWDCFIPEATMLERAREDHVPYDKWAADGWIIPTEGNQIDYDTIEARIWELTRLYNIVQCGFDLSFATMLIQHLQKERPVDWVVETPQTYGQMTAPINNVEVLLRKRRAVVDETGLESQAPMLTHEAHPVARWAFGNASIAMNGNEQKKLVKERRGKSLLRTKRIDPIIALVNAMARVQSYNPVDISAIMSDDWGM